MIARMPVRHFIWAGAETWIEPDAVHARYATLIHAPPETVFDYVSDVTRHPEWAANRMTVTPLTPGEPRVGSRYRTVASQGGRNWESIVEITRYERPGVFEFVATGGATQEPEDNPHRHTFTLTAGADGTTLELHRRSRGMNDRRAVWMKLAVAFVSSPLGQIVMPRLLRNIALGQENIKRNLERRSSSASTGG